MIGHGLRRTLVASSTALIHSDCSEDLKIGLDGVLAGTWVRDGDVFGRSGAADVVIAARVGDGAGAGPGPPVAVASRGSLEAVAPPADQLRKAVK